MSDSVQSTVLASILHAVQEEIQLQMANHIESLTEGPALTTEKPSDHTALYRISGWALKSAIDYRTKYKTVKSEDELQLLKALKRSQVSKTLPAGAQYLDRGVSDALLLQHFSNAVDGVLSTATTEVITRVHGILLTKMYNARSNEFLRSIGKIECFRKNRAVDVNIGLRDKLKSYAADKQSSTVTTSNK